MTSLGTRAVVVFSGGKQPFCTQKGLKRGCYPLLTDASLGFKSLWVLQGRMSCVGQEM